MFTVQFDNSEMIPPQIFLSQSENDPASIRCMLSYNNNLPNGVFRVTYSVFDWKYGSDHVSWMYDTMGNVITSALRVGSGRNEILQ